MTKYVYDGDQCIAEYDGSDVQLRKYVYGPGIDQPICMIEVADANAAYFYHYDALGSVVALSDAAGDTIQVYEYDVYGQVAASDPNHTNPFLFTGRRLDPETGLYYYRARYYNPALGRFLQTDPIGYEGGMNIYAYCANNSTNCIDPSGLAWEDPALRIILYDSGAKYWFDYFTFGITSDPFWDVRIDIGGAAAADAGYSCSADYIKHIFEDEGVLRGIVEAAEPDSTAVPGEKLYDWDAQITIEGLWIYGHGDTYGNNDGSSSTCVPGSSAFNTIFTSIGQGLNANHGAGALIHLRQCTAGYGQSGEDWAYNLMENAAALSGHAVTAPLGCLILKPLAGLLDSAAGLPGYAPWACSYGFGIVEPKLNSEGKVYYSSHRYRGGPELASKVKRIINAAPGITIWGLVPNKSTDTCVW